MTYPNYTPSSLPHATEFLIELLCEEIPARFQSEGTAHFKDCFIKAASDHAITIHSLSVFMTPRRITLVCAMDQDIAASTEERRGPRIGSPEKAIEGFCKSTQLSMDQLEQRDGYYYAVLQTPARPVRDALAAVMESTCQAMPWPKTMRWPDAPFPWVRPVRHIFALLGGQPIPMTLRPFQLESQAHTYGHRFLSPGSIAPISFADYVDQLEKAFVILDPAKRRAWIERDLQQQADAFNVILISDEKLLDENVGLVEYPGVFLGHIDPRLLNTPDVAIVTSMRYHQKCFAFQTKGQAPSLAPFFGAVVNTKPRDGGKALSQGYEQGMLKARLEDAHYFYTHDMAISLSHHCAKYKTVVFHDKLGTLQDKIDRMHTARHGLCATLNTEHLERAITLSKADLFTQMVGEFDELQGIMGEIYARQQGEADAVAVALREYYQPLGPDAAVPASDVGGALGLLDKLDTVCGFIGQGLAPTGSKDPFALRRAALGIIRIVLERGWRVDMRQLIQTAVESYAKTQRPLGEAAPGLISDFILTRFEHFLKHKGFSHDVIGCVLVPVKDRGVSMDLTSLLEHVGALSSWLQTKRGRSTLEAMKRVISILEASEDVTCDTQPSLFQHASENILGDAITNVTIQTGQLNSISEYLIALDTLAAPIQDFFTHVMVNDPSDDVRRNRLSLLQTARDRFERVGDIAKYL